MSAKTETSTESADLTKPLGGFLINVPVGVITFVIALAYVRESRAEAAARHLDIPGLATSALALFALTYALIEGGVKGWTAPLIIGAFALAAGAAGLFGVLEARGRNPMVDLAMFRRREFSGGTGTMMISPAARAGVASALLNASREIAGLLGITVIGAVLRTRQSAALRAGAGPVPAFVSGYHAGLLVTIALLAAGVVISYLTLRPRADAVHLDEITTVGELEAIGEALGELVVPEQAAPQS